MDRSGGSIFSRAALHDGFCLTLIGTLHHLHLKSPAEDFSRPLFLVRVYSTKFGHYYYCVCNRLPQLTVQFSCYYDSHAFSCSFPLNFSYSFYYFVMQTPNEAWFVTKIVVSVDWCHCVSLRPSGKTSAHKIHSCF